MPPFAQPTPIGLEDRLLAFAVSLLVGGAALHAGTDIVAETRDYGHAVLTALLDALELVGIGSVSALGVPGT